MAREIPDHVHSFECTGVSEAITFHFRPTSDGKDPIGRVFGWALATVNNKTGELAIQSDWGSWSYRWHVNALGSVHDGRPATLVEFIAERDDGHCDYLADKLTPRSEREQFDPEKTVRALRERLIERRIEAARGGRGHVTVRIMYNDETWPLDRETVRAVYDALGELAREDNADRFFADFFEIDGHELVTDMPHDYWRTTPSPHYYQLLHGILPALVRACAARAKDAA